MTRRVPIPRSAGRPKDADSAETRAKLLEGARRIFNRDGYAATTNRNVAAQAGITPAAIYHYFASKAELYAAVVVDVDRLVHERFAPAARTDGSLAERFSRVLEAAHELDMEDPSFAGFVVAIPTEVRRNPELVALIPVDRVRTIPVVSELVADAAAAGEFFDGVNPGDVEDLLSAVLSGLTVMTRFDDGNPRDSNAFRALRRFLSGTLVHSNPVGGLRR
ncbi:MAG TPA: TetR/AcrR family transcriptional regulator [Ilumatobacteraceae bacterium]|nr:TetR/AcrR family transcriptional regulator [Ilumatobacteraceae bacterium]